MAHSVGAEKQVTYHSLALPAPYVTAEAVIGYAKTALALDPNAYFRAFDAVVLLHWQTTDDVPEGVGKSL